MVGETVISPNFQLSQLEAITFDVGGTLIHPWPSVGHIYAETAARHGLPGISPALLRQRFIAAWAAWPDFNHSRNQWAQLVDETFRGLADPPPSQTFFPELYDYFAKPSAWRLFDDVLPALTDLAPRRLKLGLISNWDERLRSLLQGLELDRYFKSIVISAELGASKPSPVLFETAANQLGVDPGKILHVGDSLPRDVQGARAAGFYAVLIERGSHNNAPDQINSLRELCERREKFHET